MADPDPEVTEPEDGEETPISNWEFVNRVPSPEEVLKLLETLPPVWGVETKAFADYVQVLPNRKKIKRRVQLANGHSRIEEDHVDVNTIYMSVAGRIKMIEVAAERNGWRVDFVPEPMTPTGAPGLIDMSERIVYREHCQIVDLTKGDVGVGVLLGTKSGTAWIPASDKRQQAALSNPFEKCETSARGRAIAAWGFGVLPGSGVASFEEMMLAGPNRRALEADGERQGAQRRSRSDIMTELLASIEQIRQMRDITPAQMHERVVAYVQRAFQVDRDKFAKEGVDAEGQPALDLDWRQLKDGALVIVLNEMKKTIRSLTDAQASV